MYWLRLVSSYATHQHSGITFFMLLANKWKMLMCIVLQLSWFLFIVVSIRLSTSSIMNNFVKQFSSYFVEITNNSQLLQACKLTSLEIVIYNITVYYTKTLKKTALVKLQLQLSRRHNNKLMLLIINNYDVIIKLMLFIINNYDVIIKLMLLIINNNDVLIKLTSYIL